jgi:large subunit ribosomal protein L9
LRVLFLEDVINVANAGEIKEVANGYARNYLLPKNLAAVATPEQAKRIDKITRDAGEHRAREIGNWQALAHQLEGTILHIPGRVGPAGQYYGAISVTRIIQELAQDTGFDIERRTVELSDPIRQPGTYEITLRLHQSVAAQISVVAQAEGPDGEILEAALTEDESVAETPVAEDEAEDLRAHAPAPEDTEEEPEPSEDTE